MNGHHTVPTKHGKRSSHINDKRGFLIVCALNTVYPKIYWSVSKMNILTNKTKQKPNCVDISAQANYTARATAAAGKATVDSCG
jgi:hypothetical protein